MKERSEACRLNKERVYKEYGMTPHSIARDVEGIKHWLMKQPHLPQIKADQFCVQVDEWIENYLIACKNSMEKAKEGIDMYFTSRILLPEVYSSRDPLTSGFEKSFEVMNLAFSHTLTEDGRKMLLFSHNRSPVEDFEPLYMIKRISMMLDILLLEGVDFLGLEVVIDCKNVCFSHIARYNIAFTKKTFDICMKGLPQRINRIHVVNPHSTLEACLAFFKPLFSKKLNDRYCVHHDTSKFAKTIGPEVAPSDLGGEGPSIETLNRIWQKKLIDYRDWFATSNSMKSDESKRIGKCRYETSQDTCFGNQGSFRKIEVD